MVKAYLVAYVLTYLVGSRLDQMTVTVDLIVAMLDLIGRYGGRLGHLGPGGLGRHGGGYGG